MTQGDQRLPGAGPPQRERLTGPVPLYVEAHGEGPVICLAHGFGGSARNWRPQARAFGASFRTVVFDLRGHARSAAPAAAAVYRRDVLADDFDRVLDWAGAERAVVGGLSMGAGLALHYAMAHSERVAGLILAAFPPAASEGRGDWAHAFASAIDRVGLEAAGAEYAWGPKGGFDPRATEWIKAGFLEHPPHAIAHLLREVLSSQPSVAELSDRLGAFAAPALVLVGSRDRLSLASSQALAGALPSAQLEVLEGAGHLVNLERREEVSDLMLRFATRVRRADPEWTRPSTRGGVPSPRASRAEE
jgi:pimeloyl-ACP methyl ester carboxylesterase